MSKKTNIFIIIVLSILVALWIISIVFLAKDSLKKSTNEEKIITEVSYDYNEEIKEPLTENKISTISVQTTKKKNTSYLSSRSSQRNRNDEPINLEPIIENEITEQPIIQDDIEEIYTPIEEISNNVEETPLPQEDNNSNDILSYYEGHEVAGKIEIPKTNVNLYVLKDMTVFGMEIASCIYYSKGELNKYGFTLIGGHNYMNGTLFSDNYLLENGDKIYFTTPDGEKKEYTIYNKFLTSPNDVSHLQKDANCLPEIYLQCCTSDDSKVLIIQAK